MKIILLIATVLAIWQIRADEGMILDKRVKERVASLISAARAEDSARLDSEILPSSEVPSRHGATSERVKELLKDVDINKVQLTDAILDKKKNVVLVRITDPVRLDLEFAIQESTAGSKLFLKAIHP